MAEVEHARGSAGLTLVSTFAGCGGSCLGFEMAGYRTLWANEFVEAARDTYAANHPGVLLDGRDIRQVQAEDILRATGLEPGELDVLNGSPPCASFSPAGKRQAGWGQVKAYSDTAQRTDDLFFEFARILAGLKPRAFVAENVAGLTRGAALGYFKLIMRALTDAGYRVRCKVLDAQWLAVPQSRNRAIFVGVRDDLGQEPEHPQPLPYRYTLREVLPGLLRAKTRSAIGFTMEDRTDRPAPCILASEGSAEHHLIERVIHDTSGLYGCGDITDRPCPAVTVGVNAVNSRHFQVIERVVHDTDGAFEAVGDVSDKVAPAVVASRPASFKVYEKPGMDVKPRKFTMEELRIVCGFPPDFILTGSYGQQWERLGRAVPPPMMRAVAATLRDGVFTRIGRTQPGFFEAR